MRPYLAVVDVEDEGIAAQPGTPLPFPAPDDIAYVIYTSGTTGTQGVAVGHYNVTALMQSRPGGLAPGGVWSQCHSLAFDFFGVGDLRSAALGWAGGGGAWGWCVPLRNCTPCWSLSRSRYSVRPRRRSGCVVASGVGVGR